MVAKQSQYPSTFYRVSLKAVIRDSNGFVLVCKEYDSTDWSLPGGGWDHGETEHEALARELHEEVGFVGAFESKPITTATFWLEERAAWLLWIVYEVAPEHMNFTAGPQVSSIAFIDPKSLHASQSRAEKWIYEHLS